MKCVVISINKLTTPNTRVKSFGHRDKSMKTNPTEWWTNVCFSKLVPEPLQKCEHERDLHEDIDHEVHKEVAADHDTRPDCPVVRSVCTFKIVEKCPALTTTSQALSFKIGLPYIVGTKYSVDCCQWGIYRAQSVR